MVTTKTAAIDARDVHDVLSRSMLTDGMGWVLDLSKSHGTSVVDEVSGTEYLDMFTFFASNALGMNHPALREDPAFADELLQAAMNKPSNSDVYTVAMARFVETFARVLGDPALPHLFFIEGGALAVENALKVAFDWKSRHNQANGRDPELGTKVLHLTGAFHYAAPATPSPSPTLTPTKLHAFPSSTGRESTPPSSNPASTSRSLNSVLSSKRAARLPKTLTTSPVSSPNRSRARAAIGTCGLSSLPP